MEPSKTKFLIFLVVITCFQEHTFSQNLSFPLTFLRLPVIHGSNKASLSSSQPINYHTPFNYTMVLIALLPFGTPSQYIPMVLDTGSQLTWMACVGMAKKGTRFNPSKSQTFSFVNCSKTTHCPISDKWNSLGIDCDGRRKRCTYDFYYVDGTHAYGNLVKDKFHFSAAKSSDSLTLGCTVNGTSSGPGAAGILGMNRGPDSFVSQAQIQTFSYCVPKLSNKNNSIGTLIFGSNSHSSKFQYVGLVLLPNDFSKPNFNRLVYSLPLVSIVIRGTTISVPGIDYTGGGQTVIDSGSQYSQLVDVVFKSVATRVSQLVSLKLKTGSTGRGGLSLCYYGNSGKFGNMIGDIVFNFKQGMKPVISVNIPKENLFDDVNQRRGVSCLAFVGAVGDSAINIIGSFQQQNIWIEHDVNNHRVGFGAPGCSTNK